VTELAAYVLKSVPKLAQTVWKLDQKPLRFLRGEDFPLLSKTPGLLIGGNN
jgi:hypothetical protein